MSVNTYLKNLASELVLTGDEKTSIKTSIETIERRIDLYFNDKVENSFIFGSYTRGTILPRKADEESDIDYMVVFKNDKDYNPQTFLDRLRRFANKYYSRSEIFQSHPTIVLELNHIKFELVPAYKSLFFTNIPAPSSNFEDWMVTRPQKLKNDLEDANKKNNFKIKPLIRLTKYWNAQNNYVYNSYKLEKNLMDGLYLFATNLKNYLFEGINDLETYNLPQYKKDKVNRAKRIIENVKRYKNNNLTYKAESEIKKLLPSI